MAKELWDCEFCGEQFNSRASRLYHRRNNCLKNPLSKAFVGEKPPGTVTVPDSLEEATLNVETTEPEPKPEIKAPVSPNETIKKAIPKPVSGPPGPEPAEFDEITDEEIEDTPWLFLIVLILVAALAAGAIIFRHKLIAFWQAHTQQPAPEAEDART